MSEIVVVADDSSTDNEVEEIAEAIDDSVGEVVDLNHESRISKIEVFLELHAAAIEALAEKEQVHEYVDESQQMQIDSIREEVREVAEETGEVVEEIAEAIAAPEAEEAEEAQEVEDAAPTIKEHGFWRKWGS